MLLEKNMTASFTAWIEICLNSQGRKLVLVRSPRRVPGSVREVQSWSTRPLWQVRFSDLEYIIQSRRSFLVSTLTDKVYAVHMLIAFNVYYSKPLLQPFTRLNTRKFLAWKLTIKWLPRRDRYVVSWTLNFAGRNSRSRSDNCNLVYLKSNHFRQGASA